MKKFEVFYENYYSKRVSVFTEAKNEKEAIKNVKDYEGSRQVKNPNAIEISQKEFEQEDRIIV